MKIVDRKTFLALPNGTIYQDYRSTCADGNLLRKGDNITTNDYYAACLSGESVVDAHDSGDFFDKFTAMEDTGASLPANFEVECRDGMFEADARYFIYEREDVVKLIAALQGALAGYPT